MGMLIVLAVAYAAAAILAAWNIISHGEASTKAIEKILTTYNLKNEGEQAVERYADKHPLMGFLFANPVKEELELPSHEESASALSSGIASDLKEVRHGTSFFGGVVVVAPASSSPEPVFMLVTVIALERSFQCARGDLFADQRLGRLLRRRHFRARDGRVDRAGHPDGVGHFRIRRAAPGARDCRDHLGVAHQGPFRHWGISAALPASSRRSPRLR